MAATSLLKIIPRFMRVGFAEVAASGLSGLAASELTLVQTGTGMTVSQASGNLVITTGTTANAETVLRSVASFSGSMIARWKSVLSQRIANQTFRVELADLIGEGLAYTINSATSVTVTFPTTNPFTAANVGQSLRLSCITGAAGIPGRYAIAAVSGLTVTFTVAAWPSSGSGTLTLYGHNWLAAEYSGTTATNLAFDAQRRGWNSGATTATISTTASPGHVGQLSLDTNLCALADALVASSNVFQWSSRASRIENIPDEDAALYLLIVAQNGASAPASTTTWNVGFVQVEEQTRQKVAVGFSDPIPSHPQPVYSAGGSVSVSGTVTATPATPTASNVTSAASTNATSVKASAGTLYSITASNTAASARYLKLYNKASAPTVGTDVPVLTITLAASSTVNVPFGALGHRFGTGIALAITGAAGDSDTTAIGANEVKVLSAYI